MRLLLPAVVSPVLIGIDLLPDNREIRRDLVIISKVLQGLANNVRFGGKEAGMNSWMDKRTLSLTQFFRDISSSKVGHSDPSPISDLQPLDPSEFDTLRRCIVNHRDQIRSNLSRTAAGERIKFELELTLRELELFSTTGHDISLQHFMSRVSSKPHSIPNSVFVIDGNKVSLNFIRHVSQCIELIDVNMRSLDDQLF